LLIGFQDTVENVGDVFLGHSVYSPTKTRSIFVRSAVTERSPQCVCPSTELDCIFSVTASE